jgi:hypothetical protein
MRHDGPRRDSGVTLFADGHAIFGALTGLATHLLSWRVDEGLDSPGCTFRDVCHRMRVDREQLRRL